MVQDFPEARVRREPCPQRIYRNPELQRARLSRRDFELLESGVVPSET
jgi:hypothetical protein